MLDNFPAGQIEHLAQGIVVGEAGLFCDLAELTVQALNNIRRVYDFRPSVKSCVSEIRQSQVWSSENRVE